MPWAAAAAAVAGVAGSAISAGAAGDAGQTQLQAAQLSAAQQLQMFQTIQANLAPYMNLGTGAINTLTGAAPQGFTLGNGTTVGAPGTSGTATPSLLSALTTQFNPTMASLAATPGYQFTLDQGLGGVQNSNAAAGMGRSGNALKGAADYAENLAGTTYQQQFQNYLGQNKQIYDMLTGLIGTGENAAAGVGNLGIQSQNSISQLLTGGAAASAAGTVGSANAITGGLSGVGNNALLGYLLSQNQPTNNTNLSGADLYSGAGGGSGSGGWAPWLSYSL